MAHHVQLAHAGEDCDVKEAVGRIRIGLVERENLSRVIDRGPLQACPVTCRGWNPVLRALPARWSEEPRPALVSEPLSEPLSARTLC